MKIVLMVFHVMVTICLIGLVLIQKGEDVMASASTHMRGQGNMLSKVTGALGGIFFINCIVLSMLVARENTAVISSVVPVSSSDVPLPGSVPQK